MFDALGISTDGWSADLRRWGSGVWEPAIGQIAMAIRREEDQQTAYRDEQRRSIKELESDRTE